MRVRSRDFDTPTEVSGRSTGLREPASVAGQHAQRSLPDPGRARGDGQGVEDGRAVTALTPSIEKESGASSGSSP